MKLAAKEKDKLEVKQRAVRKLMEDNKIPYKPTFFEPWENPYDGKLYHIYNGKYFEHCRVKKDWHECPDIFSDQLPSIEALRK